MILFRSGPTPRSGEPLTVEEIRAHASFAHEAVPSQLRLCGERYSVDLAAIGDGKPLAALITLDELTPDRLTALGRFWAALTGKTVAPDPRITPQRRRRAQQMLRVVDARATGATYRAIADQIFPQHDQDAATWVGSAIRETTIRMARDGMKLVRGGYLALLRRPRRDR